MNFQSRHQEEPLEINLIPLIDVLLVILVFLAASTSFTQQRQLQLDLPKAQADILEEGDKITLAISKDGLYTVNDKFIEVNSSQDLANALSQYKADEAISLSIEADKQTPHGAVVQALEAARKSGIDKINFLTETGP